jgi:hypothetical protein
MLPQDAAELHERFGDSELIEFVNNPNFKIADDMATGSYPRLVVGRVHNRLISFKHLENPQ